MNIKQTLSDSSSLSGSDTETEDEDPVTTKPTSMQLWLHNKKIADKKNPPPKDSITKCIKEGIFDKEHDPSTKSTNEHQAKTITQDDQSMQSKRSTVSVDDGLQDSDLDEQTQERTKRETQKIRS